MPALQGTLRPCCTLWGHGQLWQLCCAQLCCSGENCLELASQGQLRETGRQAAKQVLCLVLC